MDDRTVGHHRNRLVCRRLLGMAAQVSGHSLDQVELLVESLLPPVVRDGVQRGRSILNNDGTLLQISLSARPDGWSVRLIGDPGTECADPWHRHQRALQALASLSHQAAAESLQEACDLAMGHLLADDLSIYRNGTMWIAAGLGMPGLALYLDAEPPGPQAAWQMARRWLQIALPDPREALGTIDSLVGFARPASFGIEGTSRDRARAKIYFRLQEQRPLGEWGMPLFASEGFARFLGLAMADFDVQATGLVGSVGFNLRTGHLADGKLDLCACKDCLNYDRPGWVSLVRELESTFGLEPLPMEDALADSAVQVAFIGFGLEVRGQRPRLNVYLKPDLRQVPPTTEGIRASLADAVDFLWAAQQPDGHWVDYDLPVGASDQWVTGYVGLALAEAGIIEPARRAAHWLLAHRGYAAGWGFNGTTGPDADSTAFAVRLLQVLGLPVEPADQAFLRSLWRPGAGIATYPRSDAWGVGHPDVTALAYLALPATEQAALREDLLDCLWRTRLASGLWPAYWWRLPLYSTYQTLGLLRRLGLGEDWLPEPQGTARYEVDDAFNLAAAIGIEGFRGRNATPLASQLIARQAPNGSWAGAANLRVTEPDCYEPWDDPRGQLYEDINRTITTATAVRVLAQVVDDGAIHWRRGE